MASFEIASSNAASRREHATAQAGNWITGGSTSPRVAVEDLNEIGEDSIPGTIQAGFRDPKCESMALSQHAMLKPSEQSHNAHCRAAYQLEDGRKTEERTIEHLAAREKEPTWGTYAVSGKKPNFALTAASRDRKRDQAKRWLRENKPRVIGMVATTALFAFNVVSLCC